MKVAVVAPSGVPFARGGAERAWDGLVAAFNDRSGVAADLIKLPSPERNLRELATSYLAFAQLDLSHFDAVVTTKYPAWMVSHPNHVIYVFHRLRGLYDTYPRHYPTRVEAPDPALRTLLDVVRGAPSRLAALEALRLTIEAIDTLGLDHPAFAHPGPLGRELVHFLDAVAFDPAAVRRYAALSDVVRKRAGYFPDGADVAVLHLPTTMSRLHDAGSQWFFTASRLDGPKRLDLLIEAYRRVPGTLPLKIAGGGPEEGRLRELAAADPRVELVGHVSDAELTDLYAGARAVPFIPLDEDWGLITVEAMRSGKPVVTCTDSGGPLELVTDRVDGFVVRPDAKRLAIALSAMADDEGLARRLGDAARRRVAGLTWEAVVGGLLGDAVGRDGRTRAGRRLAGDDRTAAPEPAPLLPRRPDKPKVLVLSTFAVHPPLGGGQLRCHHLYGGMTDEFDVEIHSLAPAHAQPATYFVHEGFGEVVVPRSTAHQRAEDEAAGELGQPVSDVAAGQHIELSPTYLDRLREAAKDAAAVVLAHPYLAPALDAAGLDLPVVYDAHNHETKLKADVVPVGQAGRDRYLAAVEAAEALAMARSALVVACSSEDIVGLVAQYGEVPGRPVIEIPNGADVSGTPFTTGEERVEARRRFLGGYQALGSRQPDREHLALFIGSWHGPNNDAAQLLLELAPLREDVLFVLAGSHTNSLVRRRIPRNVAASGVVSPLVKTQLLRAASVATNPVVGGSGTNLKLVEYLAAGAPVVSTPHGARGLGGVDGVHLTLAEPDAFLDALDAVLADPAAADARAVEARALVERRFDWHILATQLAASIKAVL